MTIQHGRNLIFVGVLDSLLCPIASTLQCRGMARGGIVLLGASDFSLWNNGQNL